MEVINVQFSPRKLMAEVIELVRKQAEDKNLLLSHHIAGEAPDQLLGDPVRIKQILLNLLSNAIKFTETGRIRLDVWVTDQQDEKVNMHFELSDTGIGMSEEQLQNLFQPFTQADAAIYERYGGTGLGLNITQRLVGLMGGSIEVQSREQVGSTFIFTLPLALPTAEVHQTDGQKSGKEDEPPAVSLSEEYPVEILVVEDHPINQQLVRALLQRLGYTPQIADNGQEALKTLAENDYEIIFMDIQMPVMDGLETTRRIREQYISGEGPVIIAMTANALHEDQAECLAAGMDDYMAKPLRPGVLESMIRKWGRSKRSGLHKDTPPIT